MFKCVSCLYTYVFELISNVNTDFYDYLLSRKLITLCSICGTLAGYTTQNRAVY